MSLVNASPSERSSDMDWLRARARAKAKANCYPTSRRIIDVAGKIVRHAGQILLKVTAATWKQLQIDAKTDSTLLLGGMRALFTIY